MQKLTLLLLHQQQTMIMCRNSQRYTSNCYYAKNPFSWKYIQTSTIMQVRSRYIWENVSMEIDTESSVTLLSLDDFKNIGGSPECKQLQ